MEERQFRMLGQPGAGSGLEVPCRNSVCAVVTTFRPGPGLPQRIVGLGNQVQWVVIVDDGASSENRAQLEAWFLGQPGLFLLHNPTNLGIAVALNRGVDQAEALGAQFVLLLDDDSLLAPGAVSAMLATLGQVSDPAILGMNFSAQEVAGAVPAEARACRPVDSLITAGSLIPLAVHRRLGPFREDLFIDYVDHEYCLRARRCGVRLLQSLAVGMVQPIGEGRKTALGTLGSVHSPFRTYYFFRNSSEVVRQFGCRYPGFALWVLWQQWKTLVKIVLFLAPRRTYLRASWRGWADFRARRFGKIPEDLVVS